MIPHPAKVAKGGEDAYFISEDMKAIGIADGKLNLTSTPMMNVDDLILTYRCWWLGRYWSGSCFIFKNVDGQWKVLC